MPVISSVTVSSPSCSRWRRSRGRPRPAAPTRIANRISGSTSPSMLRWLPTNAPNRLRGMNMSTIVAGVIAGRSALVSTCCCAWPLYCCDQPRGGLLVEAAARLQHVHHQQPERRRDRHVEEEQRERAAGERPRCESSPSCTTPFASEANTSGITTKNSMRRKTCPSGSSSVVANHCAAFEQRPRTGAEGEHDGAGDGAEHEAEQDAVRESGIGICCHESASAEPASRHFVQFGHPPQARQRSRVMRPVPLG